MGWTRAELKKRAINAFTRNYWKCVLVALILAFITPSSGGSSNSSYSGSSYGNEYDNDYDSDYNYKYNFSDAGTEIIQSGSIATLVNPTIASMSSGESAIFAGIAGIVVVIIMIAILLGVALSVFVYNPLHVGGCHFFMENSMSNAAGIGALIKAFKLNYKSSVLTMFLRDLYTFLWTCLLIIPGLIKTYEYRMVPYILADHPEMQHEEVFALSRKMMDGEKWDAFVLDLSFFGWHLLNACTFGILGIFYVNPYVYATDAELYLVLKRNKCQTHNPYLSYTTYADNNTYTGNNNTYQSR